jgi:hypothetical protein
MADESYDPADVCRLAINLAVNCGWPVFPVRLLIRPDGKADKIPQITEWQKRASIDPAEIARMWKQRPGDLVGILCGPRSNLAVVDVDTKHPTARAWWRVNHARLPITRTYETYSGGLHLYYQHREGVPTQANKLTVGIDTRAAGGLIVHWFAFGCACIDHTLPAPFPEWLHAELTYQPPPPKNNGAHTPDPDRAIDGVLKFLTAAREPNRNGSLFWSACRLVDHGCGHNRALALLLPIATSIGLTEYEARKTIASAQRTPSKGRVAA